MKRKCIRQFLFILVLTGLVPLTLQAAPGDFDTTFAGDGEVHITHPIYDPKSSRSSDLVQLPSGQLKIVVGYAGSGSSTQFVTSIYNPDGSLAPGQQSYGRLSSALPAPAMSANGNWTTDNHYVSGTMNPVVYIGTSSTQMSMITTANQKLPILDLPDGKVLIAGRTNSLTLLNFLARFNSNGTLDTTFTGYSQTIDSLALTADGGWLLGGGYSSNLVVRKIGGSTGFGISGTATIPMSLTGQRNMVLQPDGKILVSSYAGVARLLQDGQLDTSLDSDGMLTGLQVDTLAVQPDGKFLVGIGGNIWRYMSDGQIDTDFGQSGLISVGNAFVNKIVVQADGAIAALVVDGGISPPLTGVRLLRFLPGPDTDTDGVYDNADADDDNDGVPDVSDPYPQDTDNDGIPNQNDPDDDNDGVPDTSDAFPLNASESVDTDNDGTGNNADPDDDNDGLPDAMDPLPLQSKFNLNAPYKGSRLQDQSVVE